MLNGLYASQCRTVPPKSKEIKSVLIQGLDQTHKAGNDELYAILYGVSV